MEEAQHPPTSPEITTSAPVPEAPSSLQTENGTMDSLSVSRVAGGGNSSSALPRNLSTASLSQTPEACHVEDIDQGCSHVESHHKNSVLHSAVPTPVASRSPSRIALHNMAENQGVLPQMKEGMGEGAGSTRGEPMEAEEEEKGLEMKVEPKVNLDSENNVPSNASSQVENPYIAHSPAPVDHPVPAEDPKPVIAESRPVYPAPETAPSEGSVDSEEDQPIENQQVPDPASEADINWGFDDIAALQSHVNGTDSFELLKQRAPERSSSFPQAGSEEQHQTPGSDDTEQALFNMMASEVATGNGDRGMFDTPSVEQGGLFDSNGVAGAEESFFDGFSGNGAGNPTVSMGQVTDNGITTAGPGLDAEENTEKEASRYEEGLPLINNDDEAKEDTDLFGDVKTDDDFFGGLSSGGPDTGDRGISGLQRKSTIQAIDGAKGSTHPYHSGEGAAASLSAVMSEVVESTNNTPPAKDPIASLFGGSEENSGQPDGEDFFGQIQQQEKPEQVPKQESADDLTAQWQAALAGDEFLADDSEGFLPSDDEGFLPDSDDETPVQRPVHGPDGTLQGFSNISTGNIPQAPSAASRYTPQAQIPTQPSVQPQYGGTWPAPQPQQAPYNPYAPPQQAFQAPASQMPGPPPAAPYSAFGGRPPPAPEMKAQSFVDKKEGYQSPYDLPLDIGPPAIRKRPSNLQQLQSAIPAGMGSMVSPPPPVRSSSMGAFFSAEAPTQAQQPQGPPKPKVIPQQKFFEELPIGPPKQRATSALGRHPESMNRAPSGAGGYQVPPPRPESTQGFYQSPKKTFAQPVMGSPQQMSAQLAPQTTTAASRYSPAPRATSGMYAAPPAPAASVRYSPAPSTTMGYQPPPATIHPPVPSAAPYASPVSAPPAGGMKYAPRPAGPPQVGNRVPSGGFATPPQQAPPPQQPFMSPPSMTPQNLPHQHSFTASPPFHHPHSPEDPHHSHPRRFSGEHHAMHSSRPGTARSVQVSAMDIPREEEEEGATNSPQMFQNNGYPSQSPQSGVPPPTQSRYAPSRGSGRDSPASLPSVTRQNTFTPPPPSTQSPRYIPNALPQRTISPETTFQPPPRAQTQSPGMAFGKANKITQRPRDPYERPSSAFAHSSSASYASIDFHQRQQSLGLNFMAPNDEAGQDVLQRWQGAPVFCWGFGGSIAYTFPKRAQRYTSDMQQPMIKCSPGEVKVRSIKEILPFEESEGKFPGPAWSGSKSANKAKKKELLTWFTDKIEDLERRAQGEGTRAEEKVLLWKIVRVLLENDGVLEGSPEVEKATRAILSPETVEEGMGDHGSFVVMGDMSSATQGPNIERADPQAVNTIKNNLLKGDRAAAVWHAVDRKLWSHALLISGTVCRDLWKQVVQEFVKNEVKTLGEGADSLAALYETFAGNWEECVDELVSASARMGMPMLGGASRSGSVNIDEKLDRWRETLGLILSNRSPGDAESIMALGKMLVGYGRVEAGHICYLFARQGALGSTGSVFGGHDDPAADFSLLGADHRQATFGRDADSVMLSEVYELAVSLCATPSPGFPHLQSYKLQCAIVLAENGQKGEAQKYCDSIASSIKAWNKPSPYFHPGFFGGLEDLSTRLSMSPKDSSPSGTGAAGKWIPKLSSDTVSNSLWGTFNKFVAGEEEETSSTTGGEGGMMDAVAGPFAKVAGPGNVSPDISRVQSGVDLYSAYNNAPSYNGTPPMAIKPASQAANRYAPSNSYQPKSSLYEPAVNQRATSDTYKPIGYGGGYEPSSNPYAPQQQTVNPYDSPVPSSISTGYPGASTYDSRSSFEDTSSTTKPETMETSVSEPPPSSGGYQPPSAGGYEPPSTEFTPYEPENNDDENEDDKPKPKKSFMDDDDDDFAKKAEQARKLQQEEAKKKAEEEKKNSGQDEGKKGWFGGWFGKKDPNQQGPIKAKLGEESSFVYDPDLKRWVNKKAGDTAAAPPKPAPPPKRASTPTSQPSSTPSTPGFPPSGTSSAPPTSGLHAPPPPFGRSPIPSSVPSTSTPPPPSGPPASAPPSAGPPGAGPPSRPPTSISQRAPTGDTIDDLLGPPGAPVSRKSTPGGGKKRGKSRYVEVIPGQS